MENKKKIALGILIGIAIATTTFKIMDVISDTIIKIKILEQQRIDE